MALPTNGKVKAINPDQPIRILCLDGGGVKGLFTIAVLKELLVKLQKEDGMKDKQIDYFFELIAGTSTGGILATLIGVFRLPLDKIENLYWSLMKEVFSHPRQLASISKGMLNGPIYDAVKLEKLLAKNIKSWGFSPPEVTLSQASHDSPYVFLTSAQKIYENVPKYRLFLCRNYETDTFGIEGVNNYSVVEAVRASTAAPFYFDPLVKARNTQDTTVKASYYDGGILFNCPSPVAFAEAKKMFPNNKIGCLISIGTGTSTDGPTGDSALNKLQEIISIISETHSTSYVCELTLNSLKIPYHRITPNYEGKVPLDCTDEELLKKTIENVEIWLKLGYMQEKLDAIVSDILPKPQDFN